MKSGKFCKVCGRYRRECWIGDRNDQHTCVARHVPPLSPKDSKKLRAIEQDPHGVGAAKLRELNSRKTRRCQRCGEYAEACVCGTDIHHVVDSPMERWKAGIEDENNENTDSNST